MLITTCQHLKTTHDAKKKKACKTNKKDNPCWGYKQSGEGIGAEIHQLQLFQKVEKEDLQTKGGPVGEKWTWLPVDEEGPTHNSKEEWGPKKPDEKEEPHKPGDEGEHHNLHEEGEPQQQQQVKFTPF